MIFIIPIRNVYEYKAWIHKSRNINNKINAVLDKYNLFVNHKLRDADYIELYIYDVDKGNHTRSSSLPLEIQKMIFDLRDETILSVLNNRKVIPGEDYNELFNLYSNLIKFTNLNKEYKATLKNEKEKLEYLAFKYTHEDEMINNLEAEADWHIKNFLSILSNDKGKMYIIIKDKIFNYPQCFCETNKPILKEWLNRNKLEQFKLEIYSEAQIKELKLEFNIKEGD